MTRRSISKEALSRLQSVAVKSFSVPIIDTKPTIVEVANKPEDDKQDNGAFVKHIANYSIKGR